MLLYWSRTLGGPGGRKQLALDAHSFSAPGGITTDTNSGHFIAGEQPQLVIDAICQVVDADREGAE